MLLNVDIKIASKALAIRMKTAIPNIINYDKTAYVKSKLIGESVRSINDLLYYTEQEKLDGILLCSCSFAYVEHNFIHASP